MYLMIIMIWKCETHLKQKKQREKLIKFVGSLTKMFVFYT